MKQRSTSTLSLVIFVTTAMVGCGKSLVSVEGQVRQKDQPLEGASVSFIPLTPGCRPASGWTDSEGRFQLKTEQALGAFPGSYKVTITKTKAESGAKEKLAKKAAELYKGDTHLQAEYVEFHWMKTAHKHTQHLVSKVYEDPTKTPLTAEVPSKGTKNIELTVD